MTLDRLHLQAANERRSTDRRPTGSGAAAVLPPELDLIVEAVRRSCGAPARPLATAMDWKKVLEYAIAHDVVGPVDRMVSSGALTVPAETRLRLATATGMRRLRRRQQQEPEIRRTLEILLESGCSPVVLKGVDLAYTRYPIAEHRMFGDVDILLPEHQLGRATRALLAAGFTEYPDHDHGPSHQHLPPLVSPKQTMVVELHRAILEDACPFKVATSDLLDHSQPASVLGLPVRVLAPTDALLHACVHLSYGHHYARYPLRTLGDILILAASDDVRWSDFVLRVRLARADGAVYWSLQLARLWLGAPIPRWVLAALAPHPILRRSVGVVMRSGYLLDRARIPDDGTRVLFDLLLELSLFSGCPIRRQVQALLDGLFPRPDGVTHVPADVRSSRPRYFLELLRARRLWRGAAALWHISRSPGTDLSAVMAGHDRRAATGSVGGQHAPEVGGLAASEESGRRATGPAGETTTTPSSRDCRTTSERRAVNDG